MKGNVVFPNQDKLCHQSSIVNHIALWLERIVTFLIQMKFEVACTSF